MSLMKAGSFNALVTNEVNSISADFRKVRKVCNFCVNVYTDVCKCMSIYACMLYVCIIFVHINAGLMPVLK